MEETLKMRISVHDNIADSGMYELKSFTIRIAENPDGVDASCPEQVYDIAKEILSNKDSEKEHFYILLLDGKNKVKCAKHISTGTLTSSLVHPREVFKPAILGGASSIACVHNHPSSDPSPSKQDIQITDRLQEVGDLVGIPIIDHVIISELDDSYRSFQDLDLL